MHVWIVEVKKNSESKWESDSMWTARDDAREEANWQNAFNYKTRVVKYISTKGE